MVIKIKNLIKMLQEGDGNSTDALLLSAVKIVTTLVGIVSTMILSRALSLLEYGTYSQGNLVISLTTSITVLGLTDASNFFFNRPDFGKKYVSNIVLIEIIIGFCAAIVILTCREIIGDYFNNNDVSNLVTFLALRPLVNNLLASLQVLMVSLGRSKMLAMRNLAFSIVKVCIILIVAFVYRSLPLIFTAYLLVDVLNVVWFYFTYRHLAGKVRITDIDIGIIKNILIFSLPMAASIMLSTCSREIAKLIVGALENTETYAVFSNCSAQLPLDFISASFVTVLMPVLTRRIGDHANISAVKLYSKYLQIGYLLVWPFAFSLMLIPRECVTILYGEQYSIGDSVFFLYLFSYVTTFFSSTLVLTALGYTKTIMGITAASLALNSVLSYIGCSVFGVIGTAFVSVIVNILTAIATFVFSCLGLSANPLEVLAPKIFLKTILTLLCLVVPALCVKLVLVSANAPPLVTALIVAALYLGLFFGTKRMDLRSLLASINSIA